MRVRQSLPVLFLLLLVTAGLFTMHTTGHASLPGAAGTHMASGHQQQLSGTVAAQLIVPIPQDRTQAWAALVSTPMSEQMPGMLMAACVAILCGALTAAFAIFLLRRRSGSFVQPLWQLAARTTMGRGPPLSCIGLLLADLSVARN